jgi:UDP-2,4-diacetamido-2,4,6-trideoxy-beta-L-altropyranose hydrolase
MRFLFRADASVLMGTGHIVRCAALAERLADNGHEVRFLCRELPGNLIAWVEAQGFGVTRLAGDFVAALVPTGDAAACLAAIGQQRYDWLIVDHYELDTVWERAMSVVADRIFAIDDLGRQHDCAMVLDQNYANPVHDHYPGRIAPFCKLLVGPDFALLRPEFSGLRSVSLARERNRISRILIFMGGSDPTNETTKALDGVARTALASAVIDVVIGSSNPHRQMVENACAQLPTVKFHVQTSRMAELMTSADLAIGAGGSATWERCTLGLPALVTILSENQASIAKSLVAAGAQELVGWSREITADNYVRALGMLDTKRRKAMSAISAKICDGGGTSRVTSLLLRESATTASDVRLSNG